MQNHRGGRSRRVAAWIALAGFCGGLAELVWVALYCAVSSTRGEGVARQITASLFPALAAGPQAVADGIAIHMVLAVALAAAFALAIWLPFARARGPLATLVASALTLAAVWALNFFVVLPVLNPAFVTLLPYPVSFASKMLFAVSMALILVRADSRQSLERPVSGQPGGAVHG